VTLPDSDRRLRKIRGAILDGIPLTWDPARVTLVVGPGVLEPLSGALLAVSVLAL
jgi:hypothetical protein